MNNDRLVFWLLNKRGLKRVPVFPTDIVHYYLYCNQTLSNPFQQVGDVLRYKTNTTLWNHFHVLVKSCLTGFIETNSRLIPWGKVLKEDRGHNIMIHSGNVSLYSGWSISVATID